MRQAEWATLRLLLELSRPRPQIRPRRLSLESVQRAPQEGGQVALESLAHNLLMVVKESKYYSAVVDVLLHQDLWCLDVYSRACHWLSPQVHYHCSQDGHRWVAHWVLNRWRGDQAQQWQGVLVWSQEVMVSGTRTVVLRLHPPHPVPAGSRRLPHQAWHDGCLCAEIVSSSCPHACQVASAVQLQPPSPSWPMVSLSLSQPCSWSVEKEALEQSHFAFSWGSLN